MSAAGRTAGTVLLLSRLGFGASYALRPGGAGGWVGPVAARPGGRILARGLAARDLALAAGTLRSLGRRARREASVWFIAQAVADFVDLGATWSERRRLTRSQAALGMGIAAASTLAALVASGGYAGSEVPEHEG
jgi:hypothetical protein